MSEEKMTPELAAELIDFALNPEFLTFILDEADRRYQSKLQKQPFVFGAAVTVGYYGREIKGYADAEHRCELAAQDMLRAEKERDELLAKGKGNVFVHRHHYDQALSQAAALAGALEDICHPNMRPEGPAQGAIDIARSALAAYRAWEKERGR